MLLNKNKQNEFDEKRKKADDKHLSGEYVTSFLRNADASSGFSTEKYYIALSDVEVLL